MYFTIFVSKYLADALCLSSLLASLLCFPPAPSSAFRCIRACIRAGCNVYFSQPTNEFPKQSYIYYIPMMSNTHKLLKVM